MFKDIKDIWAAIIYVINPPPLSPEKQREIDTQFAEEVPEWWFGAKAVKVPEHEWIQPKSGGFPNIYDGQGLRSDSGDAVTVAEQIAERGYKKTTVLTKAECGEMKVYKLSKLQTGLHNVTLAERIKPHWQLNKKPAEIGKLVGCSESTARHYCVCFDRANKQNNATPLF